MRRLIHFGRNEPWRMQRSAAVSEVSGGGDLSAFDELVRRTESRVRSVALAILRDRAEAEDAAQEAFLRAFRRASSYRGEGPVGAWLCRIAVRSAHDALRRAARQRRLIEVAKQPGDVEAEAGSVDPEEELRQRTEMDSALRTLPQTSGRRWC